MVLCLASGMLFAQSTTQGAIGGTVFDTSDAVVANATVTIHNDATNAEFVVKTDASGFFKVPLVEPGTYTVTVSAASFGGYKAKGVLVTLGQATTLAPHLKVGASSATVEVSAEAPVLNFDAPDFSTNINQRALEDVPVNNMRWSSLALATPGVVSDSNGFGLVSVRGISPVLNTVLIDGADNDQAYYSEERGRTREAYSTPPAAIEEVVVNTGVYSTQYGRSAGAVINSITKSGTNKLHGEAYFYDREGSWGSFNPWTTNTVATQPTPGNYVFTTSPYKPKDSRRIWGFTAGGDLVKNKLFWEYTYDQHHRLFPGTAKATNPASFFTLPDTALNGTATCNVATGYFVAGTGTFTQATLDGQVCTLAARLGLASYAAGVTAYDNGLVSLLSDLGTVPRKGDQVVNMPKLDWQVNSKNQVSLVLNRLRWDSPGGVQTQATNNYAIDTFGMDYVKLDYGVAKWTSQITSTLSNEILYQYGRELNDESQQPYSTFSKNYLTGTNGNVPEVALNTSVGFYLGSPYYSYRKALPDERKWQVEDTAYYSKGNHSLKFGIDFLHNYDLTNNTYESNGYITYSTVANFLSDIGTEGGSSDKCNTSTNTNGTVMTTGTSSRSAVGAYPCYSSVVQGFGPPKYDVATMDYAGFIQDNWKITPRLSLELGLRYDYERLPAPSPNLTKVVGAFTPYLGLPFTNGVTGLSFTPAVANESLLNRPSDKNNFGPRVGFSYNVFSSGRTVLRGGYGIFYGRIQNGEILNLLENTGSTNGQYTVSLKPNPAANTGNTSITPPVFPNILPTTGSNFTPASSFTIASTTSNFLAKNLQNPQIHEYTLAVQQDLTKGNILSVSYLGALGRELPNYLNVNLYNSTLTGTGVLPVTTATVTVSDSTGKGPLKNSAVYTVPKVYASNNNNGFSTITEMASNINSSYNALVFEVQNRSLKTIQYDISYTWSHALDFNQNANTSSTATNNWYDPFGSARANYGNSNYNVPNRIVGSVLYTLPGLKGGSNWLKYVVNDWSINTSFQIQNGLPYSAVLTGGGYVTGTALSSNSWNGVSNGSFIPAIGRNTYKYKRDIVDDLRLQKLIKFTDRFKVEGRVDIFNVANHQNYTGVNNGAYALSSSGNAATATYQSNFGTYNNSNSSGFLYTPRQVQIGFKGFF